MIRAKTKDLFDDHSTLTERQKNNSTANTVEIEHCAIKLHSKPKRLVFELTNACHLRCKMCGRNDAHFILTRFENSSFCLPFHD
jgi:hypothetical protein